MSFTVDISKFVKNAEGEADRIRRSVIIELFSSVIGDTPVDTGRAKGNWQTNVGEPIDTPIDRSDKSGAVATNEAMGNLGKMGDEVHLTNNLPYIEVLESGNSTQAPAGMLRKNLVRITNILRKEAKRK